MLGLVSFGFGSWAAVTSIPYIKWTAIAIFGVLAIVTLVLDTVGIYLEFKGPETATGIRGVAVNLMAQEPARPMPMHIGSLTDEFAAEICTWRYPAPYGCYDMTSADPDELVRPELGFYALVSAGELIGFRSFGADGRVAGWDYDDTALDTGGGLRPDLVGRGLGRAAISAGLAFGRSQFAPMAFRVTVAAFNTRALRTVEALGFARISRFEATTDRRPFEVLVRSER